MDGILGSRALVVLYRLSRVISEKREEPISQVRGWVNGNIAISIVRSYSQIICGDWLPSPLREQELYWDP